MNVDNVLKPFPCKENDCSMSFFTEDHLSVHLQAKHNKLNLEIPKDSNITIFADQTPTPTRLLNNCEELRVFDDLQNINPFEEGFRRAVEDNSNGIASNSCFLTTPSNQDTLHTPLILAHFEHRQMKSEPTTELPPQEEPENLTLPTTLDDSTNIPKATQPSDTTTNDLKSTQKPPIPLLPKPSIIYTAPIITSPTAIYPESLSADVSRSNESVRDKLKNIILSNNGSQIERKRIKSEHVPTIIIGTVPLVAPPTNLVINSSNKTMNTSNDMTVSTIKTSDNGSASRKRTRAEKTDASTLKVERNRAAARRYRTKMKIQSQALQEKYDKSQREMALLRKELTDLKKELTQVKTLLLLHKDCPVSKAMTSNS